MVPPLLMHHVVSRGDSEDCGRPGPLTFNKNNVTFHPYRHGSSPVLSFLDHLYYISHDRLQPDGLPAHVDQRTLNAGTSSAVILKGFL